MLRAGGVPRVASPAPASPAARASASPTGAGPPPRTASRVPGESNQTLYASEQGLPWSIFGDPYLSVTWYIDISSANFSTELSSSAGGLSTDVINAQGMAPGEYNYSFPNVGPDHVPYPSSGTFNLSGSATAPCCVNVGAVFSPLYTVTFVQSGLPNGTRWSVTFNGTPEGAQGSSSAQFVAVNGSYAYSAATSAPYTAPSGTVVVQGRQVRVTVQFQAETFYPLRFTETGLSGPGINWSVAVAGTTHFSENSTISLSVLNGTYHYQVNAIPGRQATPPNGTVTVAGSGQSVAVSFARLYDVSINITGLPRNSVWYLNFSDGRQWSSVSPVWGIQLVNGTYSYTLATLASGYSAPPGNLTIAGAPISVVFSFSQGSTSSSSSLLSPLVLSALAGTALAVVAVVAVVLLRRRTRRP